MAPRKRKANDSLNASEAPAGPQKRISKVDREKLVCKRKLEALEHSESLSTDDRFNSIEKQCLLNAYNTHGYHVFQDMSLLHQVLPNRRENDLKGLLDRLQSNLQAVEEETDNIQAWQKLSQTLLGNFSKNKSVNFADALSDSLMEAASKLRSQVREGTSKSDDLDQTDYPQLLNSFAQLLSGKFPDNMTPAIANVSIKLFDHIESLVDKLDIERKLPTIMDGSWIVSSTEKIKRRQELALIGLKELDKMAKRGPSIRDIEKSQHIEALCLELPKIKRITEVLNPLRINDSLVSGLLDL